MRSIWQPTANQARWLVGLSAIAITTAIFIAHIVPGFIGYHRGTNTLSGLAILVSAGAMAGPIALALWHRQNAWAIFLAAAWLVWLLPLGIRIGPILVEGGRGGIAANNFVAGVGFIIFWSFTGWLALRAGQRGLFALAFTFAAGRVLVLYFEAFGGLSATGFGLIGGGLLLLGLSWVGWKLSRITSPTGSTPGAAP